MEAKLHVVLSAWKNFDITSTQQMLDEIAAEITAKQDETDISRKKLVDQLKEFRNNVSDETKIQTASVIKSFQQEVDFLNKKSKFAEAAFLKCYQKFLDIVDPVGTLEYYKNIQKKTNKLNDLELENKNLQEILNDYNNEFKEVKNQDLTIKTLKEKIKKLESEMDVTTAYNIKEIEKRILHEFNAKQQMINAEKEYAVQQLTEMENQKSSLEHHFEQLQSEFFDIKTKLDDGNVGHTEETELLSNDLDRVNQKNSVLQKEVDNLKSQLFEDSNSKTEFPNTEHAEVSYLESELKKKDEEISQLIHDLKTLEENCRANEEKSRLSSQVLQTKLQVSKKATSDLENLVVAQQDYDEIKRELNVIKFVEFGSNEMDSQFYKTTNSKPLELLLLEKNKTLQTENTTSKLNITSLKEELSNADNINKELLQNNSIQASLIKQLEMDVLSINSSSFKVPEEMKSQAALLSKAVHSADHESIPDYTQFSQIHNQYTENFNTNSILPIISAQRERFKNRNTELESELYLKNNQVITLQNEAESLRNDNLKLYEKIRYLRSFENNRGSLETKAESRYSNQYESGLDPFSTFSLRERQRKYQSLSPFEKITLFLGKFILQNKTARTAAFIYFMFVHCLVFFALFLLAQTESCKRDVSTRCAEMFKAHMHDVHGNNNFDIQ